MIPKECCYEHCNPMSKFNMDISGFFDGFDLSVSCAYCLYWEMASIPMVYRKYVKTSELLQGMHLFLCCCWNSGSDIISYLCSNFMFLNKSVIDRLYSVNAWLEGHLY